MEIVIKHSHCYTADEARCDIPAWVPGVSQGYIVVWEHFGTLGGALVLGRFCTLACGVSA